MATQYLCPLSLIPQWFTNLGIMAAGGQVTTYIAGTTTPVTTFTDNTGLVANPNPMTLSASGRPVAASGAPVAFWAPSGTLLKFVVTDASGTQLDALDNLSLLNDPSAFGSLQSLLANPASSNVSGVGPVAGVDLVANALKSYDIFADVRAANQPVLASGQTLTASVQGGLAVNDGLGGDFYWSPASTANDNGTTVLKPNSIASATPGRWLRLYTPPFGAASSIASASTTDIGTLGTNVVTITGTNSIGSLGSSATTARPLWFLTFASALTLQNNAAILALPGGSNISVNPGDTAIFLCVGTNQFNLIGYLRAIDQAQIRIAKTADQAVTSSTALVGDTQLVTANLPVGATYLAQLRYQFLGTTTTTQGYKASLVFSGTLTGVSTGAGVNSNNLTAGAFIGGFGSAFAVSGISDTTPDVFNLDVVFTVLTTGSLAAQFAQNSSSANATTAKANSSLTLTRIA